MNIFKKIFDKNLTFLKGNARNPQSREVVTDPIREVKNTKQILLYKNICYCTIKYNL